MYVKDGAIILADSLRVLGGILSRPVVLLAFSTGGPSSIYEQLFIC